MVDDGLPVADPGSVEVRFCIAVSMDRSAVRAHEVSASAIGGRSTRLAIRGSLSRANRKPPRLGAGSPQSAMAVARSYLKTAAGVELPPAHTSISGAREAAVCPRYRRRRLPQ